jgi:hypothetical protein
MAWLYSMVLSLLFTGGKPFVFRSKKIKKAHSGRGKKRANMKHEPTA